MGGRASKIKGTRVEYQVRDYFRTLDYKADRVPSSGAAQGFPGDVKISKDGRDTIVEVKTRRSAFKSVYAFYNARTTVDRPCVSVSFNGVCIDITKDYRTLLTPVESYPDALGFLGVLPRTMKRILKMREWLKKADVLAIKDNNQPLLFIRYI